MVTIPLYPKEVDEIMTQQKRDRNERDARRFHQFIKTLEKASGPVIQDIGCGDREMLVDRDNPEGPITPRHTSRPPGRDQGEMTMKVYERICLRDWFVEAENGDRQDLKRGKTYTTSASKDGEVTVFSSFWVKAPIDIFEPVTEQRP